GDCLVANGAPAPNPVKQLLLGYETGRFFEQYRQHCSGFWSEPCGLAIAVQFAGFDVEAHIAERRHVPGVFQRLWRVPRILPEFTHYFPLLAPNDCPTRDCRQQLGEVWMSCLFRPVLGLVVLIALHRPAAADVISDWNEKVISFSIARGCGPAELRIMAITDLALFDAVNAVEREYGHYLVKFVVTAPTSKEAAAAAAAAGVLAGFDPSAAKEAKLALVAYLADIPDGVPKQNGIAL